VASTAEHALETPSLRISRGRALVLVAAGAALVASLVFVLRRSPTCPTRGSG
jgi:hypothetical protein